MCIDLRKEQPIRLADVPKLNWILPRRNGRPLHIATIHRWCLRGIRGVRLEFVQFGGTRVTSEAALWRFFERLGSTRQELPRSGDRQNAKQLEEELDRAGL